MEIEERLAIKCREYLRSEDSTLRYRHKWDVTGEDSEIMVKVFEKDCQSAMVLQALVLP